MTSGPTHFEAARQHLALEVDHLGHAFEHDAGVRRARQQLFCAGTTETRATTASSPPCRQQPNRARLASVLLTSPSASASSDREIGRRGAPLMSIIGDGVAGIGERHRDAATHAAGAETGDRGASGSHWLESSRSRVCSSALVEVAETEILPACRPLRKSSPQIAPPMARKNHASGVATPASSADRHQKRQAKPQILPHVAMLCQHDPPRASRRNRSGDRASRDHTSILALACVVMCQRKVRRAIAEPSRTRDPLGIECVGDAADRRLCAFLVNVPALEMLDRTGVHDDQRRMDDRPGVHQRAPTARRRTARSRLERRVRSRSSA